VSAAQYRTILGAAAPPSIAKTVGPERIYRKIEEALERRGQAMLYGPPGTGKTYTARRAAVWLLDGGSSSEHAAALLSDDNAMAERERQLSASSAPSHRVWFVVANP
jgi:5-methylcytosine-specific restriction enzyme B